MLQLLIHWFGDYILQSDYIALNKAKKSDVCALHVLLYLPGFVLLTHSPAALLVIGITHFMIDRFSLAKYLIWIKNHINPWLGYAPWSWCNIFGTHDGGFHELVRTKRDNLELMYWQRPYYVSFVLYLIVDNGLHLAINYAAIRFL